MVIREGNILVGTPWQSSERDICKAVFSVDKCKFFCYRKNVMIRRRLELLLGLNAPVGFIGPP
jgi:hypothetical protein